MRVVLTILAVLFVLPSVVLADGLTAIEFIATDDGEPSAVALHASPDDALAAPDNEIDALILAFANSTGDNADDRVEAMGPPHDVPAPVGPRRLGSGIADPSPPPSWDPSPGLRPPRLSA